MGYIETISERMVRLERFAYTDMGTFGKLSLPGFECITVERPWINNEPNISCIPCGGYGLELGVYNKGGYEAYEITGVPDRDLIKIHIANIMDNVEGCVGPGEELFWYKGKLAVSNSWRALGGFMEAMGGVSTAKIVICNAEFGMIK